jgi:hypothetical protein
MLIKTFLAVVIFAIVWLWGMWVAFTQGDDVVARFGRWAIRNAQQSVERMGLLARVQGWLAQIANR